MGKVAYIYKLYPRDIKIEWKSVENEVKRKITEIGGIEIAGSEIEDIAFGLTAMKIKVIMEEKEGLSDKFEEILRNLKGVEGFELLHFSRV